MIPYDWEQPRNARGEAISASERNHVVEPPFDHVIQRKLAKQRENVPKCGLLGQSPTTRFGSDNTGKKWLSRS